jgi:hypothetical protein
LLKVLDEVCYDYVIINTRIRYAPMVWQKVRNTLEVER